MLYSFALLEQGATHGEPCRFHAFRRIPFRRGLSEFAQGVRRGQARPRAAARDHVIGRRAAAAGVRHERSARGRRARRPGAAAPRLDRRARGRRRGRAGGPRARIRADTGIVAPAGRPRRAGRHPDALRAQGRGDPGDGVRCPARGIRPGLRPCRGGPRAGHHPGQRQPPRAGADGDWPQLPGEDQRQHRQLRGHLVDRRGGGEAPLGDAVGRRHHHGSVHRRRHPRDTRVDHPQRTGAGRHRAHLPGPGEGGRTARGADLGDLPRHPHRAGGAGRRLFHGARRRVAPLCPADRRASDRDRVAGRFDPRQVVPGPSPGELRLYALPRDLRDHAGLRRVVLARRRAAARLHRRRQRRGAVRRAPDAGRAYPHRLGA